MTTVAATDALDVVGGGPGRDDDHADAEYVEVRLAPADRATMDAEFAAFVAARSPELLRTAWLLCGDRDRAEELAQAALVRTYVAWPRARAGDPLGYARRVLANQRIDTWRRRRREVLTSPDELPDGTRTGAARRSETDRVADRDQLVRALALLTARQRRVVVLRHLVGLSEAEVAADLGVSVGTVKSTASRGLAVLRAELTQTPDAARRGASTAATRSEP